MNTNISLAYRILYYTYGITPIITGIDKYFDYLVDWDIYLNDAIPLSIGICPEYFMYMVGVVEIIAGILVLLKPQIGGYVVSVWLVLISINLVSMGAHYHEGCEYAMTHYDVALRDVAMAVGAYVLVLLAKSLKRQD